ncbi:MAG TPA: Na+/H+ antiporter NhaC family protein [Candidatus Polarisedimenticolaceae bacterium]|nr:Na+/H+ antiporter NhaC family protein [Candidatus Polarisedimenticolaceae bacterium]
MLLAVATAAAAAPACGAVEVEFTVAPPPVAVPDLPARFSIRLSPSSGFASLQVEIRAAETDRLLVTGEAAAGVETVMTIDHATASGRYRVVAAGHPQTTKAIDVRTIPGWSTLAPPVTAILLALLFRQVVPALCAGIWIGGWIGFGGPVVGAMRMIDRHVVGSLATTDHASIIIFSLLLGGMVGIVSRSGGTHGLVDVLRPYATNSRRGQCVTWVLGLLIFFDDYANTLLVGNTMRPVTDRLRISREKLAYIVDSTAAPVTGIALVSTWIGYEVSLIADSLRVTGIDEQAYGVFLRSLPYNFYPILTLLFGMLVATQLRDFGPMRDAERRARAGRVLSDKAVPLSDFDGAALSPVEHKPRRWINAVAPVVVVLVVTFAALWFTGRTSLAGDGTTAESNLRGLATVFGAGDSFEALLWASLSGCIVALLLAVTQRILTVGEAMAAWLNGLKSMTMAIVILVLAWSISDVCVDLGTSGYMVAALSDRLDPRVVPLIVFVISAITAFSTGTSWGTMGILIPLAVPTAYGVAGAAGYDADHATAILLCSISAVLAGAIFGDHCSPISDTTVLSSMASGCDHIDHVRTQLPYAVVVALVAIVCGYLPAGFGLSPWICVLAGSALLFVVLRVVGRSDTG